MNKSFLIIMAAALMFSACNADQESYVPGNTDTISNADTEGISLFGDDQQGVSVSYAADGVYHSAYECADNGIATWALATRGDLCLKIRVVNTTKKAKTAYRRDFLLDIDGKALRTPSNLYSYQQRAIKYVVIPAGGTTTIYLYYQNLFEAISGRWPSMPFDVDATYSIDMYLGANKSYLFGCNIYAMPGYDEWIDRNGHNL